MGVFIASFMLVSVVKISAAGNLSGHFWGGSEDDPENNMDGTTCWTDVNKNGVRDRGEVLACKNGVIDENETGLGWISVSNPRGLYSVSIPAEDGPAAGYAWSPNYGYLDFQPQINCTTGTAGDGQYAALSCSPPSGKAGVFRVGKYLEGWARFVSIAKATKYSDGINKPFNNAGGWNGWVHMKGETYGVEISKMDGTGNNPTYAWSSEVGWIDFSRAKLTPPPEIILQSDTQIVLLTKDTPRSGKANLTWTVKNATSCLASGGWVGDRNPKTGKNEVTVNAPSTDYALTCKGPGGESSETIKIMAGCMEKKCSSNTCATKISSPKNSFDSCVNSCLTNDECLPMDMRIQSGGYKEVSP